MLPVTVSHTEACVIVSIVQLVDFAGMHKTGCSGKQKNGHICLAHTYLIMSWKPLLLFLLVLLRETQICIQYELNLHCLEGADLLAVIPVSQDESRVRAHLSNLLLCDI